MIRILTNLMVFSITIIMGVSIFELSVRYFFPQFDPSGHVTFRVNKDGVPLSEKRGEFRQIKNTGDYNVLVKINQNGLRESKSLTKATPKDIFVVGDSFSFGWGVEEHERFSNQLESSIGRSVFNISIPTDFDGYDKLISYAENNGANISNLIIGVTMENDIRVYEQSTTKEIKKPPISINVLNLSNLKHYLTARSAAYFLTTSIIHKNKVLKNFGIRTFLITPNLAALINRIPNERMIISSAKRLKRISQKFKSLILIIPSRALWTGSEQEKNIADNSHSLFISEIKKLKIQFVDLRAVFEETGNPMGFHFKHDGHWTAAAHKLAASQLNGKLNSIASEMLVKGK
jgi:hypothetical protein